MDGIELSMSHSAILPENGCFGRLSYNQLRRGNR